MASWFQYQAWDGSVVWVRWLPRSPVNKRSKCDRPQCKRSGRWVDAKERRLQVDNDKGPTRKKGKGKRHQYLCTDCAVNVPDVEMDQLGMEL